MDVSVSTFRTDFQPSLTLPGSPSSLPPECGMTNVYEGFTSRDVLLCARTAAKI